MQSNAVKAGASKSGVTPGSRGFVRPVRPDVHRPQACVSPRHRRMRMRMMNPSSFETCFGMGAGVSPFIEGQLIDALKEFDKARARYIPIDLVEEPSQFVVKADIPGVPKEDIKVTVDDDVLTVSIKDVSDDTDKSAESSEEINYMRRERSSNFAPRSLRMPDTANTEDVTAAHSNGVIVITVPKKDEVVAKKRSISIE